MLSVEGHEGNHFQDLGGDSPCMMLWLSPSSFGSHISTPPFLDCRLLSTHKANTPLTGLRGLNELTCGWGLTLLHINGSTVIGSSATLRWRMSCREPEQEAGLMAIM